MSNADKLWNAFVATAKVLPESDLENFGRALYFGTAFKSLGRGALKSAHSIALIIGATPAQVYVALATQSWGYSDLKEIADGLEKPLKFHELSKSNQRRIIIASDNIPWPVILPGPAMPPRVPLSPLTKVPRDPFASNPSEKSTTDERVASPAPILGLVAFLSMIGISLLMKKGGI